MEAGELRDQTRDGFKVWSDCMEPGWSTFCYYYGMRNDRVRCERKMGDANASIPTVQPFFGRPMWGAYSASAALNSVSFASRISIESGIIASYGLSKRFEAVRNCRSVKKKDMKWNNATPKMMVDPENYEVHADGVLADVEPADKLPLGRAYNLF